MKILERKIVESNSGISHHIPDSLSHSSFPRVKPPTYDGQTVWANYYVQFEIIAEANNWDERTKACQLVASLRDPAVGVLLTLPADRRLDFPALVNALELRYGDQHQKETSRIQLRSRRQKPGESLQELASDVEKLSQHAFVDCPLEVRESMAVQYFTDAIQDPDVQQAVIMAECKNIHCALSHARKFEIARQASRSACAVRGATIRDRPLENQDVLRLLKELLDHLRRSGRESCKQQVRCWMCGCKDHLRRDCPRKEKGRLKECGTGIHHRKVTTQGNVNALPRRPSPVERPHRSRPETNADFRRKEIVRKVHCVDNSTATKDPWSEEEVRRAQEEDPDISPILSLKETSSQQPDWKEVLPYSPTTKRYCALWDSLELRDGVLYHKWEDGNSHRWQLLLPRSKIPSVLKETHNSAADGHFGVSQTLDKVRERFFWDNDRLDVERWCRECTDCAASQKRIQRPSVTTSYYRST